MSKQAFMQVKKLRYDALPLKYAHPGDSGMDVFACALKRIDKDNKLHEDDRDHWIIQPKETVLVCTGWAASIPEGTELQVRLNSGNGLKTKMRIPNAPGTIDSGYRGEIGVILENTGEVPFILRKNAKVAQIVLCPVLKAIVREVQELDNTERKDAGYGSTGVMNEKTNGLTSISQMVEQNFEGIH